MAEQTVLAVISVGAGAFRRPTLAFQDRWEAVSLPMSTQAVVLWVGDDMAPLIIDDNMAAADLRDLLDGARGHVWAARLRYWADALDPSTSPATSTGATDDDEDVAT